MSSSSRSLARWSILVLVGLLVPAAGASIARASHASPPAARLEATIFSYDGHEFTRTMTTLMTKDGKPAVNTKLEHDNPAYAALTQNHSYSGPATVFGKNFQANYAPMTGPDGKVTGALFVAVPQ
jgi:cache 3/cache 2 fusion protein